MIGSLIRRGPPRTGVKGTRCLMKRAEQGQVTGIEGSPAGLVATRRLRPRGLASRTGAASTGVAAGAD